MNKIIIAIVAIVVIAGGIFAFNKKDNNKQSDQQATTSQTSTTEPTETASGSSSSAANPLDPDNYTQGAEIGDTVNAIDQSSVSIDIKDFIFQTTYLKIKKGTTVTWTNQGQIAHTVTSDEGSPKKGLDSQLLSNGESYSFTFTEPGLYEYFCTPHPTQMKAVITVVE